MEWTKEKPKSVGLYWVWQPNNQWPCNGIVRAVEVEFDKSPDKILCAWVPEGDFATVPTDLNDSFTWDNSVWMGPIDRPLAPIGELLKWTAHDLL